ncbi:hypothetical protein [Chryseobacterium sp. PET-29]|nr:hypothetical protein [Chryseobacterium sp. PET-29]
MKLKCRMREVCHSYCFFIVAISGYPVLNLGLRRRFTEADKN